MLRLCQCIENHIQRKKWTDKKRTIKKKICSGHKKKFMGIYNCRLAQIWRSNFLSLDIPWYFVYILLHNRCGYFRPLHKYFTHPFLISACYNKHPKCIWLILVLFCRTELIVDVYNISILYIILIDRYEIIILCQHCSI